MLEEPPLVQIRKPARRPTAAQIAALADQPTGFLCDAMDGKGALSHDLRLLDPKALPDRFCGVAQTADNGPDDILATLTALTQLQNGDVMVAALHEPEATIAGTLLARAGWAPGGEVEAPDGDPAESEASAGA